MQMVRKFAAGIRALFKKRREDAELDEELRYFVEQSASAGFAHFRRSAADAKAVRAEDSGP
jgi:hypothetical protein